MLWRVSRYSGPGLPKPTIRYFIRLPQDRPGLVADYFLAFRLLGVAGGRCRWSSARCGSGRWRTSGTRRDSPGGGRRNSAFGGGGSSHGDLLLLPLVTYRHHHIGRSFQHGEPFELQVAYVDRVVDLQLGHIQFEVLREAGWAGP